MKNKYILTIALAFASIGLFAQTDWTATGEPADWEVAANWSNGVPAEDSKTVFKNPAGADCNINDATAVVGQLVMGDGDANPYGGRLTVKDGSVLTTKQLTEWSAVGYNNSAEMVIEAGGHVESDHRFHVGLVDPRKDNGADPVAILEVAGTLKVNGEMVDNKNFSINPDDHPGWVAETYITAGGVIDCPFFWMGEGLLDISGGTLIIRENPDFYMSWKDATMGELLDEAITKGWLTADGGTEEPIVEMEITGVDTVLYVTSPSTVGVFDNKVARKASIGVYPNPATDVVNFTENVDEVKIYSITGEIVLRRNNVSAVDIETLKPGYYIIKSEANRSTYIDKLLVK